MRTYFKPRFGIGTVRCLFSLVCGAGGPKGARLNWPRAKVTGTKFWGEARESETSWDASPGAKLATRTFGLAAPGRLEALGVGYFLFVILINTFCPPRNPPFSRFLLRAMLVVRGALLAALCGKKNLRHSNGNRGNPLF